MERYLDMRGGSRASTGFDSVCVAIFAGYVEVVVRLYTRDGGTKEDQIAGHMTTIKYISYHGIVWRAVLISMVGNGNRIRKAMGGRLLYGGEEDHVRTQVI